VGCPGPEGVDDEFGWQSVALRSFASDPRTRGDGSSSSRERPAISSVTPGTVRRRSAYRGQRIWNQGPPSCPSARCPGLRAASPSVPVWIAIGAAIIALATLVVYLRKQVGFENQFGSVYLLGVLVVSMVWKFRLAMTMSLASAAAVDCVMNWPTDLVLSLTDDGVVIAVFLVVALLSNTLAGLARTRGGRSGCAPTRGGSRRGIGLADVAD
jgi:hypothetical protein